MTASAVKVWLAHLTARRAAGRFLSACDRAGIPALLVKGILLGVVAYDDVAERPLSDVDVLVRPTDFLRVVALARREGWPRTWDSKSPGVVNVTVDNVLVDVSAFVGPAGTTALGVRDLLARATSSDRDLGFRHLRIDLHDHALLMAVDVFKDKFGWAKPKAREDLVRLAKQPGFDAALLAMRARQARLETMLWIVARWVLAGASSPGWSRVLERLERRPLRRRYAARYATEALGSVHASYPWRAALTARMVSDVGWRRVASVLAGAVGVLAYVAGGRRVTQASRPARPTDA